MNAKQINYAMNAKKAKKLRKIIRKNYGLAPRPWWLPDRLWRWLLSKLLK